MKSNIKALLAAAGVAAFAFSPAHAYEAEAEKTKSGSLIGASAGMPPPGIYMFNQVFTYQTNLVGPGTALFGDHVGRNLYVDVQGFIFVPGWTFLGATYDALIVQPFVAAALSDPLATNISGMFNTYLVPIELSWTKIGGTGFAVKTGLGIYVPTGTIQGASGLQNVGNPFTTFQPELALSYLGGGWNLTAYMYAELNTANTRTNYTTGDIFHADFTATYTIGKWTFGPVGYYVGQVSDDKCPVGVCTAFYGPGALGVLAKVTPTGVIFGNTQRYNVFAVGGLIEYNFGPATASVWVTQDVLANAKNSASAALLIPDQSAISRGLTVFGTLSYALWNPPAPPSAPMIHK
jgi:hypothetical protein